MAFRVVAAHIKAVQILCKVAPTVTHMSHVLMCQFLEMCAVRSGHMSTTKSLGMHQCMFSKLMICHKQCSVVALKILWYLDFIFNRTFTVRAAEMSEQYSTRKYGQ